MFFLRFSPEGGLVALESRQVEQDFFGGGWVLANNDMLKKDFWDLFLLDTAYRNMFRSILSDFELVKGLYDVRARAEWSRQWAHTLSTMTSEQTSS